MRSIARRHEGSGERVTVDRSADLRGPPRPEQLAGSRHCHVGGDGSVLLDRRGECVVRWKHGRLNAERAWTSSPAVASERCRWTSARPAGALSSATLPPTDVAWLGPYPDTGLAAGPASPDARYEQREAVEMAFVAALQHLPGDQRAAHLLFEVLGFSAAEIAEMIKTSTASVNSALQRARRIVAERVPPRSQQQTSRELDDERPGAVVAGYSAALERGDADTLVALLTEDVTWSMPPLPHCWRWSVGLARSRSW
jgi:hypothetical protein